MVGAQSQPEFTLDRPLPNTYWVIPGRLLAGEYPGAADDTEARRRLARLLEAGVNSFVDLTEDGELPPYRHLLPKHSDYLRVGIVDTGVPNNVAQTRELLAAIRAALARERRVYLHCRARIRRRGLAIGWFLAGGTASGQTTLQTPNRPLAPRTPLASWATV